MPPEALQSTVESQESDVSLDAAALMTYRGLSILGKASQNMWPAAVHPPRGNAEAGVSLIDREEPI